MITIDLKTGTRVKIYSSIMELPANRHKDFQKYLIQDSGIGSTMDDVNNHFSNLDRYLSAGRLEEAIRERTNLHYNIFYMLRGIDIKSFTFGSLIHSINDKLVTDYSENNLKVILDEISEGGLTYGMVLETIEEVKKKLTPN